MAAAPDADVGAAEAAMAGTTIAAPGMAAAPEAETAGADAVVEGRSRMLPAEAFGRSFEE